MYLVWCPLQSKHRISSGFPVYIPLPPPSGLCSTCTKSEWYNWLQVQDKLTFRLWTAGLTYLLSSATNTGDPLSTLVWCYPYYPLARREVTCHGWPGCDHDIKETHVTGVVHTSTQTTQHSGCQSGARHRPSAMAPRCRQFRQAGPPRASAAPRRTYQTSELYNTFHQQPTHLWAWA